MRKMVMRRFALLTPARLLARAARIFLLVTRHLSLATAFAFLLVTLHSSLVTVLPAQGVITTVAGKAVAGFSGLPLDKYS